MSGKESGKGIYQGKGGRGCRGVRGRVRSAKGYSYSGATTKHKVLCSSLVIHFFD